MALARKRDWIPWRRCQAGTAGAKAWRRLHSSSEQCRVAGAQVHEEV